MNNSKKVNGKSSRRVYSRSDRAITLIALIVTIIVLLILAGVTISMAVNKKGIFNKAKVATGAYKNAAEGEQSGLDAADKEIDKYMPGGSGSGSSGTDNGGASGSESGGGTSGSGNSGSSTSESSNASGTGGSVEKPVKPTLQPDELYGSTQKRINANPIYAENLIYADYNNDGYADGIIVADSNGKAVNIDSIGSGDFSDYSVNKNFKYINDTNKSKEIPGYLVTRTKASNKFYVLSLADYDSSTSHTWYKSAYGKMTDYRRDQNDPTSVLWGTGENNTRYMIQRMASHGSYNPDYGDPTDSDIWKVLQVRPTGWFVPSEEEWSTFITNLKAQGLTTSNYSSLFGLSSYYWSSSQGGDNRAWCVTFDGGGMNTNSVNNASGLRLCATF